MNKVEKRIHKLGLEDNPHIKLNGYYYNEIDKMTDLELIIKYSDLFNSPASVFRQLYYDSIYSVNPFLKLLP